MFLITTSCPVNMGSQNQYTIRKYLFWLLLLALVVILLSYSNILYFIHSVTVFEKTGFNSWKYKLIRYNNIPQNLYIYIYNKIMVLKLYFLLYILSSNFTLFNTQYLTVLTKFVSLVKSPKRVNTVELLKAKNSRYIFNTFSHWNN